MKSNTCARPYFDAIHVQMIVPKRNTVEIEDSYGAGTHGKGLKKKATWKITGAKT